MIVKGFNEEAGNHTRCDWVPPVFAGDDDLL